VRRSIGLTLARRRPGRAALERLARVARRTSSVAAPAHGGWLPAWLRTELVDRTGLDELLHAPPHAPAGLDDVRAWRYHYVFTQLHHRGMAWSERTYARYGLGFSDPFSDRRLAAFAVAAPQCVLGRPWELEKPLLRSATEGIMPEAARREARKIVPQPLFDKGLREHADAVRELLRAPLLADRGWVDPVALRHHYEAWLAGAPLDASFWHALSVEYWLREHSP
jgi:asparagine synthase (glutamine-hydrolysing)